MRIRLLTVAALALALGACSAMGAPVQPAPPPNYAELTGEEVRGTNYQNLYDVVQALRPLWLRTRSQGSIRQDARVQVYVDNLHQGSVEVLRRMPTTGIKTMRYLDAATAAIRYPHVQHAGVIVITTGN